MSLAKSNIQNPFKPYSDMGGDDLRLALPIQIWLPLGVHMVALKNKILHIAPVLNMNERQIDYFIESVRRCGLDVEDIEIELFDRAELNLILQKDYDAAADHCEKTLLEWMDNAHNGEDPIFYARRLRHDIMAEAVKMHATEVVFYYGVDNNQNGAIKYNVHGHMVAMHYLPDNLSLEFHKLLITQGAYEMDWHGRLITVTCEDQPMPAPQQGGQLRMLISDSARVPSFSVMENLSVQTYPEIEQDIHALIKNLKQNGAGLYVLSAQYPDNLRLLQQSLLQKCGKDLPVEALNVDTVEQTLLNHDLKSKQVIGMVATETIQHAVAAIAPFLQDFVAAIHLRAVAQTCPHCAQMHKASDYLSSQYAQRLQIAAQDILSFANPDGCEICYYTGVSEMLYLPSFAFRKAERGGKEKGDIVFYDDRAMIRGQILSGRIDPVVGTRFL